MKARLLGIILVLFGLAGIAEAQQPMCFVCGKAIVEHFFTMEDQSDGTRRNICKDCHELPDRCFFCGLPIKDSETKLPDGRCICARDAQGIVTSDADATDICNQVRNDLDRQFSRFLAFPENNVNLSLADRFQLENLFTAPGSVNSCVSVYGATQSNQLPGNHYVHRVNLLSHLKKSRLMAVCAHEFTHTWLNENLNSERHALINRDSVEGFCEFIAYKYMESLQETAEMQVIIRNSYTKGQVNIMIDADKQFGFESVLEWVKSGEDTKLDAANIERIRVTKGETHIASTLSNVPALLAVPTAVKTAEPATLMLKGISGADDRHFALINDTTFETGEREKVRVGNSTVAVRCLEIKASSVVIQLETSGEKKELFLKQE